MAVISISGLTQPGFVPKSLTQHLFSRCVRPLLFATHNCQSLSSNLKLEQLGLDFERYKLDFLALQDAKIGKRHDNDTYSCIGAWSKWKRNENREACLSFCECSNLIILPTASSNTPLDTLPHGRDTTTAQTMQSIPIYNQIDYIAISNQFKRSVKNVHSLSGCALPSDHRLVTMNLMPPKRHIHELQRCKHSLCGS